MKMTELAKDYRESAALLKNRMEELRGRLSSEKMCEMEKFRLRGRIESLASMYRDVSETALVMERYYDRGYRCNARYRI